MSALKETYDRVLSGSGQVVGIVGEAGVGKSRLLFEMRNRLAPDEAVYLEGRCLHFGGAMAYLPVLDILRAYFDIQDGDREAIVKKKMRDIIARLDENLDHVIAPLQEILSLTEDDDAFKQLEPKIKREKTFDALRDLLVRSSQEKPLVLAVEDMHWIDKTSEDFLGYLIDWLAASPILLVLLYRPEYTHQWASKTYYSQIGLDQLGPASSSELIQALLEDGRVSPDLQQLIQDRAAGNPLFMEEFTHSLLENGTIEKADQRYAVKESLADIQVPDTIQGIIAARMDRLEDNIKRTMQVASVIGRDFAYRILQAITGIREELKSYLLNLQGLEFIYEKRLFPELEYIFKHALTQEVAYNSLLSNRRKEIHQRIGDAIEKLYAENLEEFYEVLAYHYSRGAAFEKACQYLKLSGKKATRSHAPWEAYAFYKEAVELLQKPPETEEKQKELIEVIRSMRTPLGILGFPEGSLSFYQLGERLAKDLGDAGHLASIYSGMGTYYSHTGDYLTAFRYTEEGFEQSRKAQEIELMVPLGFSLCLSYIGTGQYEKIVQKMPGVITLLEKTGRESDFFTMAMNPYSFIGGLHSTALCGLGRFVEGKEYLEKALRNATRLGDSATLGQTQLFYGLLFYNVGDFETAKEHLEKCIAHCEEAKYSMVLAQALCTLGHVNSFLGDPETGRRQAEEGLRIYRDIGIEAILSFHHWQMGSIHLDLSDLENAGTSMGEALRLSRKNSEKGFEGLAMVGLGRVFGMRQPRRMEQVEECFSKGLALLHDLKAKPYYSQGRMFLGELYLDAGEKEKAMENLKEAEVMFHEMGMEYWLDRTRKLLERI